MFHARRLAPRDFPQLGEPYRRMVCGLRRKLQHAAYWIALGFGRTGHGEWMVVALLTFGGKCLRDSQKHKRRCGAANFQQLASILDRAAGSRRQRIETSFRFGSLKPDLLGYGYSIPLRHMFSGVSHNFSEHMPLNRKAPNRIMLLSHFSFLSSLLRSWLT
jgi:hypothetical protein